VERARSAQVRGAVPSISDGTRPIVDGVSGSRPRAEVLILLVLLLLVGLLVVGRVRTRGLSERGPSLETTLGAVEDELACLKRVAEESITREFEEVAATPAPDIFAEPAPVRPEVVVAEVQRVRELTFERIPEPVYLTASELSERASGYAADYPSDEAAADSDLLSSLGAVPEGSDLKELTAAALGEQVAGFYDTDTKQIVVTGDPEAGLDPIEELTLAHEFEHALADQVLGLPVDEDFPADGTEDSTLAATAVVEGDATLTMALYSFTGAAIAPTALFGTELVDAAGTASLPYYLERGMIFPYAEGLGFVCHLYRQGGWSAVNEAYANPPTTTAQILFSERYGVEEEALDPRDSVSPGPGWSNEDVQAFGAADLLFLFEAPGGRTDRVLDEPKDRAAGWAGGEVFLWSREDGLGTATGMVLVQRSGERSLCRSMKEWYRAAFPEAARARRLPGEEMAARGTDQAASLRCDGSEVRLGIADDLGIARRVIG
jgi:hypothetical protein